MKLLRNLATAVIVTSLAFGSVAARERKQRPVNLYLSTGSADSDCTPTQLTTRAQGQSDCGPINPTGGSTTWTSAADDEGFPFIAKGDQEAEVTIVIEDGLGLGIGGSYEITVDVVLDGDQTLEATMTDTFDVADGTLVIEFTIPIEDEMYIDGGSVTVTGTGVGLPVGYSVNGSGGSFIKILPVPED